MIKQLLEFEPYTDKNGYIHSNVHGTNNGNLYTSWACVLSFKEKTSFEDRFAIAKYWKQTIEKSRISSGVFSRGPGATIPNSHDDYRGIAFASAFMDGGTIAREIWDHGKDNLFFFFDQTINDCNEIPKQFLGRFIDLWLIVYLAMGRDIGFISSTICRLYLALNTRLKSDHDAWFTAIMIHYLLDLNYRKQWYSLNRHTNFYSKLYRRFIFGLATLWAEYTKDTSFPLSQNSFYNSGESYGTLDLVYYGR